MGDLTARTKMRTLATHFAGEFPKTSQLATAMPLNVYCAYDSFLTENDSFLKAFDSKFKKMSSEIIFSDQITVCKIQLAQKQNLNSLKKLSVIIPSRNEAENLRIVDRDFKWAENPVY